jgi:hypothetical protein
MPTVVALKYHTHDGVEHQEGDEYEVPDEQLENLTAQGMVALPENAQKPKTEEPGA